MVAVGIWLQLARPRRGFPDGRSRERHIRIRRLRLQGINSCSKPLAAPSPEGLPAELSRDDHFLGGPWAPSLYRAWHEPHAWSTSSSCLEKPGVSLAAARAVSRAVASA